jgi:hypothetical protein
MKQILLLCCFAITSSFAFSQQPIDVTEQTIKVGAFKTEEMYFGFAAGDQVIFNFSEAGNKDLKEIEVIEWPSTSKFSDYKTSKIENKIFTVNSTTVFKFRFYNSALSGRVCRIKLQRIPASSRTEQFNTSVFWKTQYDTAYTLVPERFLIKRAFVPKVITPVTDYFINSGSNATFRGGKSRVTFPVSLPRNTVEWYYQFSATRNEEEVQGVKQKFNLISELSNLIDKTGGISFGIDALTKPPGANYSDVYLLNFENSRLFEAKLAYKYYITGTRENIKSGIVKMQGGAGETYMIGIKNPDASYGVNVAIECVAIVLEEEWGVKDSQKLNVTSREVPYMNN